MTNFDFSFSEIFVKIKRKLLPCKRTSFSIQEKMMLKGTQLVERDLNLFNIIQQINKMKATLIVLLRTQSNKLDLIQQQYFNDTMLYIDDEEFQKRRQRKSNYERFLERAERIIMKMIKKSYTNGTIEEFKRKLSVIPDKQPSSKKKKRKDCSMDSSRQHIG